MTWVKVVEDTLHEPLPLLTVAVAVAPDDTPVTMRDTTPPWGRPATREKSDWSNLPAFQIQ